MSKLGLPSTICQCRLRYIGVDVAVAQQISEELSKTNELLGSRWDMRICWLNLNHWHVDHSVRRIRRYASFAAEFKRWNYRSDIVRVNNVVIEGNDDRFAQRIRDTKIIDLEVGSCDVVVRECLS